MLDKPEAEPIAWLYTHEDGSRFFSSVRQNQPFHDMAPERKNGWTETPLYNRVKQLARHREQERNSAMQVEQIDRDAVVSAISAVVDDGFGVGCCIMSPTDGHELAAYITEAFARHRIAERERVVGEICEFLRDYPAEMYKRDIAYTIAHRIQVEFGGRDV